jgi:hypothetical protein
MVISKIKSRVKGETRLICIISKYKICHEKPPDTESTARVESQPGWNGRSVNRFYAVVSSLLMTEYTDLYYRAHERKQTKPRDNRS